MKTKLFGWLVVLSLLVGIPVTLWAFTDVFTITTPTKSSEVKDIDEYIRLGTKRALAERLTIDHNFFGPDTQAYGGILYTKSTNGVSSLCFLTNGDTEIRLTYGSNSITAIGSVSVKDYGALGDGITDDRAAIQAAIDAVAAAGGGVVSLEGGKSYYICMIDTDSPTFNDPVFALTIPTSAHSIIFNGNGSEITMGDTNCVVVKYHNGYYYAMLGVDVGVDSTIIQNVKFRYTGPWCTESSYLDSLNGLGIAPRVNGVIVNGNHCTLENIEATKCFNGIMSDWNPLVSSGHEGEYLTIINANCHGNSYAGAMLWGHYAKVIGGWFNYNGREAESDVLIPGEKSANYRDGYGIIMNSGYSSISGATACYNYGHGIDTHGTTSITITGNLARWNGFEYAGTNSADIYVIAAERAIITGNTVGGYNGATGAYHHGIWWLNTEDAVPGLAWKGAIISNNVIDNGESTSGAFLEGIRISAAKADSIVITGNIIRNSGVGIYVVPVSTPYWGIYSLTIANNALLSCGQIILNYVGAALIYNNTFTGVAGTSLRLTNVSTFKEGGTFSPGSIRLLVSLREDSNGNPTKGTYRRGDVMYRNAPNLSFATANDTMAMVCLTDGSLTDTPFTDGAGNSILCDVVTGSSNVILKSALPKAQFVTGKILSIGTSTKKYEIIFRDETYPDTKLIINPVSDVTATNVSINYSTPTFRKWGQRGL